MKLIIFMASGSVLIVMLLLILRQYLQYDHIQEKGFARTYKLLNMRDRMMLYTVLSFACVVVCYLTRHGIRHLL